MYYVPYTMYYTVLVLVFVLVPVLAAAGVCEQQHSLLCEPSPCDQAAEIALQPLICCSERLSSQGSSSPDNCFCSQTPVARVSILVSFAGQRDRHGPWQSRQPSRSHRLSPSLGRVISETICYSNMIVFI